MGLSDTFVKQVKLLKPAGDKYSDGQGMYLLVNSAGKYWRFDYRFFGKRKTLAVGVYPAVSLAMARTRRLEARELLADGVDPGSAKRDAKTAKLLASQHTFEVVARLWLEKIDHQPARRAGGGPEDRGTRGHRIRTSSQAVVWTGIPVRRGYSFGGTGCDRRPEGRAGICPD